MKGDAASRKQQEQSLPVAAESRCPQDLYSGERGSLESRILPLAQCGWWQLQSYSSYLQMFQGVPCNSISPKAVPLGFVFFCKLSRGGGSEERPLGGGVRPSTVQEVWTTIQKMPFYRYCLSTITFDLVIFLPSIIKSGKPIVRYNSVLAICFTNGNVTIMINMSFPSFWTNLFADNFVRNSCELGYTCAQLSASNCYKAATLYSLLSRCQG